MLDFIKIALAKGLVPCGGPDESACGLPEFYKLVENVMHFMLIIAIPLAVMVIIYGGFLFLTSGGSETRIKQGKDAMLSAIVGLAIVFGSYIIIWLIGEALGVKIIGE